MILKRFFIPLAVMAVLLLWVVFDLSVPMEVHFSTRIMMFVAALYPIFAAWAKLLDGFLGRLLTFVTHLHLITEFTQPALQ